MIRRPPRSTLSPSSAASDVYKRQTDAFVTSAGALRYLFRVRMCQCSHARPPHRAVQSQRPRIPMRGHTSTETRESPDRSCVGAAPTRIANRDTRHADTNLQWLAMHRSRPLANESQHQGRSALQAHCAVKENPCAHFAECWCVSPAHVRRPNDGTEGRGRPNASTL